MTVAECYLVFARLMETCPGASVYVEHAETGMPLVLTRIEPRAAGEHRYEPAGLYLVPGEQAA